jgi:hypothetical protein
VVAVAVRRGPCHGFSIPWQGPSSRPGIKAEVALVLAGAAGSPKPGLASFHPA